MKTLAAIVALISLVMMFVTWNTPLAIAWTVAFCGWLPHVFETRRESDHGHQA